VKNKLIYSLLVTFFIFSQSVYAQNPMPDAGAIEESTPKETQLERNEDFIEDDQSSQADVEEVEPDTRQPQTMDDGQVKVLVRQFDINQSEILSEEEINSITSKYVGKQLGIDQLKDITNDINALYVKKGFITARAYLPPQTVKSGIITIKLIEGRVGNISIEGNKWTKRSYIEARISEKPGELFDLKELENDILKFNRQHIVKLRASLKPGEEVGETDIQLVANDPFPFHLSGTFDNTGRSTVGVLRGGVAFSSDSLFGFRDRFVMGYSRAKSTDVAYSNYSFPVGKYGTRLGGSFAFSNIKITKGPFKPLDITGQSYNYGGFVTHPFISTRKFDFTGEMGVNFRQVYTHINAFDLRLSPTQVRTLTAALNFEYRDKWGRWMSRHAFVNGLDLLGGSSRFFKYDGSVTRLHNFGHGVIGIFRGATQLTGDNLPPVEQFQLGGSSTVRGYSEGLLIGDKGYFFSAELRVPLPLPKHIGKLAVRDRIRGVLFIDHGGTFLDGTTAHHTDYLTGIGFGLRGAITKYVSGRIDWGFALGRREDPQPTARMHFGLQANPF
jgi:hemolysin activation/secretion protein